MAKVSFSKFGAKVNTEKKVYNFINSKGENIEYEINKYLPFADKLDLISNIINQSVDDNGYYNPLRLKLYMTLEVVYAYTNLNFTDKMKEDPFKLYDSIINTNILDNIIDAIGDQDWKEIENYTHLVIDNIYKYKNSAMGILEMITEDYDGLNLDAQNIQKALGDPENLTLLKDVMTKLG